MLAEPFANVLDNTGKGVSLADNRLHAFEYMLDEIAEEDKERERKKLEAAKL